MNPLVLGVDFGTSGVRVLIIDAQSGETISTAEGRFPMWDVGRYCSPERSVFRQHPRELVDTFSSVARSAIDPLSQIQREAIVGISVDTTGSSPTPIGSDGLPLAFGSEYKDHPDAMMVLWKDHSAGTEAGEISRALEIDYSSEWFWAKVLHCARRSPKVQAAAATWAEHADWFPAYLCGNGDPVSWRRCRSGATHKALWGQSVLGGATKDGFPSNEAFGQVDPYLRFVRTTMSDEVYSPTERFGSLSADRARDLGLPTGISVGVGVFDAHSAAFAGGVRPGTIVKIIGTSSSDIALSEEGEAVALPGVESVGIGSILPDLPTIESGQAAFGDLTGWLVDLVTAFSGDVPISRDTVFTALEKLAYDIPFAEVPIALDWFNGRRSPYGRTDVSGGFIGLQISTPPKALYLSLLEAVAFATRTGYDHLRNQGLPVDSIRVLGGVADRSELVPQILADVLGAPVSVRETFSASARGASIYAAIAAGVYSDPYEAQDELQLKERRRVTPRTERSLVHNDRFRRYQKLGAFVEGLTGSNGGTNEGDLS